MKQLTKIQKLTLFFVIAYIVWEIAVYFWSSNLPKSDPVIRADLVFIYPLLAVFLGISIYQFVKSKE